MAMDPDLWAGVDSFFEKHLLGPTDALDRLPDENRAVGLPEIDVTPCLARLLQLLIRIHGAKRILEIGTLGGFSAVSMARALPPDGELVTLEIDPHHAAVAQQNFERFGVDGIIELMLGDAQESLGRLVESKTIVFDFVFIDADKANNPNYFRSALRLSRPGTVIVVDNVVRGGEILDHETDDADVRGVQELFRLIRDEPAVTATAVQTVAGKGYDGILIAVVDPPCDAD